MVKSDDRRALLVDNLADHVLAHGLQAAGLRALAAAAQTSDRMLLYYFKDKAEIIAATLDCVARRQMAMLAAPGAARQGFEPLRADLAAMLFDDRMWPFMRLWLEVAARSAQGDPICRSVGETIGRGFLAWGEARLDSPAERLQADAARLLVSIEGMVLLKSIGLDDVIRRTF